MADPFSKDCCSTSPSDDGVADSGYKQARVLNTNVLANVYLPVAGIPDVSVQFRFYNPQDGVCYKIEPADAVTNLAANVLPGWETFEDSGEQTTLCGSGLGGTVYYQARICRVKTYSLTGHITGTAVALDGGASIPAGVYTITYDSGAINGHPAAPNSWSGGKWNPASGTGYKLQTAAGGLIGYTPGIIGGYATSAAAQTANAGQTTTVSFPGGQVWLKFFDVSYDDNVAKPPAPTFIFSTESAGEAVDLWLVPPHLPYTFTNHGVCYRIDNTSTASTSPGTIADGSTETSGCDDGDCTDCDPSNLDDFLVALGVTDTMPISSCQIAYQIGSTPSTSGNFSLSGRTYHYTRDAGPVNTSGMTCPCPNEGGFKYTIERTA